MASKDDFDPVTESGWRMGFSAILRKELKTWFGSPAWWQQALLWITILGLFGSVAIQEPEVGMAIYYFMATIFPGIPIIIISHEILLEEKRSGSAAWVLSKPVSRTSFIVAKFIHCAVSFTVSMVLIPGIVVYIIHYAFGAAPEFSAFLLSLGPLILWHMFLTFLTLCSSVFFDQAGPTMAAPFAFLFIGISMGQTPSIGPYGPWGLFQVSISLVTDTTYPIYPVIITIVILAILLFIAIWRFKDYEF